MICYRLNRITAEGNKKTLCQCSKPETIKNNPRYKNLGDGYFIGKYAVLGNKLKLIEKIKI